MTALIIVIILAVLIAIWCVSTVNDFKKKEICVQEGLSGVEVALTKRYDMLTKMLDTAKGYMEHENELFTKVIELAPRNERGRNEQCGEANERTSGKAICCCRGISRTSFR